MDSRSFLILAEIIGNVEVKCMKKSKLAHAIVENYTLSPTRLVPDVIHSFVW